MQYKIRGGTFPVVECNLSDGEKMISESGSMVWMSPNMKMQTESGGIRKMFSRRFSGEKTYQNIYTCQGEGLIAFGSSFPGQIKAVEISSENEMIVQKRAFLASEEGVEFSIFLNLGLGVGLFGGEGFIMQRLSGNGIAFVEIDGELVEYDLKPSQKIIVDTGHVAGFSDGVRMDIQKVQGVKNMFFGGEGVFNTVLTGPGKIWLQTMPLNNVASTVLQFITNGND